MTCSASARVINRFLSYLLSIFRRRSRMSLGMLLPCNDSAMDSGYKNHLMYDDGMFMWYDSGLCMRSICGMVSSHPQPLV
jgi:hypothetical protein